MARLYYLIVFVVLFAPLFLAGQNECNQTATGIPLVLCSQMPDDINVCEETKQITFFIENSTTFQAQNINATVTLPLGLEYIAGSVSTATENNISNLSAPTFTLANLPAGNSISFTISFKVNCNVFDNPPGTQFNQTLNLSYLINGLNSNATHQSKVISILEPAISVLSVTNKIYSGVVGDVFTRCVTITNEGLGYVRNFQVMDNHGGDISITSVDLNNISSQTPTSVVYSFGASLISTIGNGNNLFENGETITFCEEVRVDDCREVSTLFQTSWGCDGQDCQAKAGGGSESANVIFPGIIPNLTSYVDGDAPSCLDGNVLPNTIVFKNQGVGTATNMVVDVYTGSLVTGSISSAINHYIDTLSIEVLVNGTPQSFTLDSTYKRNTNGNSYCGLSNPAMGFRLNVPNLASSDSLEVKFDIIRCAPTDCRSENFNGWQYSASYQSICGDQYFIDPIGKLGTAIAWVANANNAVESFTDGQTKTVKFTNNNFTFRQLPNNNQSKWIMSISKNSCYSMQGNVVIYNGDSSRVWESDAIQEFDTAVLATFNGPFPHNINLHTVEFNLKANCSNCPTVTIDTNAIEPCSQYGGTSVSSSGLQTTTDIGISIDFIPDTACSTVFNLSCDQGFRAELSSCSSGCDSGLIITSSYFHRTTLGNPDNDEDGQPDNNGKASHPELRLDYAVFGDTLNNRTVGVMDFPGGSEWDLCYVRVNFNEFMDFFDPITDTIFIHSAGNIYTSVNNPPTVNLNTPSSGNYLYDLSASKLITKGELPSGFKYKDGDSIVFSGYYRVTKNLRNDLQPDYNEPLSGNVIMHVNDSVEPTRNCHRFTCTSPNFNLTLLPIIYYAGGSNSLFTTQSCDSIIINHSLVYRVGDWNKPIGWNFFPKEYRNFGVLDTIVYELPEGYLLKRARFREVRHYEDGGSNATIYSNNTDNANLAFINVTPALIDSSMYYFDIESLYDNINLFKGDESYASLLEIVLEPSCAVPDAVEFQTDINTIWKGTYADSSIVVSRQTFRRHRYDAPKVKLLPDNPNVFPVHDSAEWDLTIRNDALNSVANNLWLAELSGTNNAQIRAIYDLDNGDTIPFVNGIYQTGEVLGAQERRFKVVVDFNVCVRDSIVLGMGWDCPGYPDSIGDYACTPNQVSLYFTPELPGIQDSIRSDMDTAALCDSITYTLYLKNVFKGTAYNFNVSASVPTGMNYIPNESTIRYPIGSAPRPINDPTMTGSVLSWDLTVLDSILQAQGFHGLTGDNEIELSFKVETSCDFISGSKVNFYNEVTANCGKILSSNVSQSPSLIINDAVAPYASTLKIAPFQVTPCSENAVIDITLINNGPDPVSTADSIYVSLPEYLSFEGNFIGYHNAPLPSSMNVTVDGLNNSIYSWKMPNGVVVGDSVKFSFEITGDDIGLSCQLIPSIETYATTSTSAICASTSTTCAIQTVTGDTLRNSFLLKSYPEILNLDANATPAPPTGEMVSLNFDFTLTGENIDAIHNQVFYIFEDSDGDSLLSSTDALIDSIVFTDSLIVNDTINIQKDFLLAAASSCNGLFVLLDSSINECFCNTEYAYTRIELAANYQDTIACSDLPITIGIDSINGYTYTWNPNTFLDNANKAQPIFTYTNTSSVIDSVYLDVTIDQGGCFVYDTLLVEVSPQPTANAGNDSTLCEATSILLNGNANDSLETSVWSILSNTTGNPASVVPSNDPNGNLLVSGYGELVLAFEKSTAYCTPVKDTVTFTIFEPSISTVNDTVFCNLSSLTIDRASVYPSLPSVNYYWYADSMGLAFTDSSDLNTQVNGLSIGNNTISLVSTNGVCPADTAKMNLFRIRPHSAILPADTSFCEDSTLVVSAQMWDTANYERGVWQVDPTYNSMGISISNDTIVSLSNILYGESRLILEVTSDYCPSVYDTLQIVRFEQSQSSINDTVFCNLSSLTIDRASVYPSLPSVNYYWYADSMGLAFTDSSDLNTQVNGLSIGKNTISLVSTNGVCPADTAKMNLFRVRPHVAVLPADTSFCEDSSLVVLTQMWDTANYEHGVWQVDPAYNLMGMSVSNDTVVSLSNILYGESRLILEVTSDYCPSAYDTIRLVRDELPTATTSPLLLCDKDSVGLSGAITPLQALAQWRKSATSTVTIDDSSSLQTYIRFTNYGSSELYLDVENGVCPVVTDTVGIINLLPLQAVLPPDTSICEPSTLFIRGNAPDTNNYEYGTWLIDPTYNANLVVTKSNDSTGELTGLAYGENRVVWEISGDYCLTDRDTLSVFVFETPQATVMNDTSLCQQTNLFLRSSFYPNNATNFEWNIDPQYNNPNIPTFNNYQVVNPSANMPSVTTTMNTMTVGTYQLVWQVENGVCPVATDTLLVQNNWKPTADYIHPISEICKNECIDFTDMSSVNAPDLLVHYYWYDDDSIISDIASPTLCFTEADTNAITLIVETDKGCYDTIFRSNNIIVHPLPEAGFSFAPVECIKVDEMIFVTDESIGASEYFYDWDDGYETTEQEPGHYYGDTGIFELQQLVTNPQGCIDTTSHYVYVGIQTTIFVPNAFTPDDNGVNDVFIPVAHGLVEYRLSIYNRWGDLVFTTNEPTIGWDGMEKGKPAKEDVYVWKLIYSELCSDEEVTKVIRGHVTLIK